MSWRKRARATLLVAVGVVRLLVGEGSEKAGERERERETSR